MEEISVGITLLSLLLGYLEKRKLRNEAEQDDLLKQFETGMRSQLAVFVEDQKLKKSQADKISFLLIQLLSQILKIRSKWVKNLKGKSAHVKEGEIEDEVHEKLNPLYNQIVDILQKAPVIKVAGETYDHTDMFQEIKEKFHIDDVTELIFDKMVFW